MIATMTVVDGCCGDDFDTEHADYECHNDDPKRLEGMKMMR